LTIDQSSSFSASQDKVIESTQLALVSLCSSSQFAMKDRSRISNHPAYLSTPPNIIDVSLPWLC